MLAKFWPRSKPHLPPQPRHKSTATATQPNASRAYSMADVYIHPTAEVSPRATLGAGTKVWHQAQVREGAVVGRNCILGKGAYVDFGVQIGDNVKIQNRASVYHGVTIENGV